MSLFKMIAAAIVTVGAIAGGSGAAEAAVIYEFVPTEVRVAPDGGRAVFDDAALKKGTSRGHVSPGIDMLDGLISFQFGGDNIVDAYFFEFDFLLTSTNLVGEIILTPRSGTEAYFGSIEDIYFGSDGIMECWNGETTGACGAKGVWRRVPEPATALLLGAGLASFAIVRRRSGAALSS